MATNADLASGELRGFLEAFARLNDKTNHGCTFTFDRLPEARTVSKAIELLFRGEATRVTVTPIENWPQALRAIFKLWLFQFQVTGMAHLVDRNKSFALSYDQGRGQIIDWVMERLDRIVQPAAVWKVEVETKSFYECGVDDIVFESAGAS